MDNSNGTQPTVTNTITATFNCPVDRAFKTPILGDATKILIGYWGMQLVAGFADDQTWGKPGGTRVPLTAGPLSFMAPRFGIDEIFVRHENHYWQWGVSRFGPAIFFSTHNCGEWWTTDNHNGTITVTWKYTWYSTSWLTHPYNWLFVKLFWRKVMKNGMANIKQMAEAGEGYLYE
jgi:hypothetical protein